MRLAILSDIHANAAALSPVLAQAREHGVEELILLGDFVGYYYQPDQVIEAILAWPHTAVLGNHDRMVLEARQDQRIRTEYRQKYGHGLDVALESLSPAGLDWLAALPPSRRITRGGMHFDLHHGAPDDPDSYVYPDAPRARLRECAASGADLVLMGHTHHAFVARIGSTLLVNPGSVGQARDLGGFACWALFDTDTSSLTIRRTAYDPSALLVEVEKRDQALPNNARVLYRGNLALTRMLGIGETS